MCVQRATGMPERLLRCLLLLTLVMLAVNACSAEEPAAERANSEFQVAFDSGAIVSLKSGRDSFHTEYIQPVEPLRGQDGVVSSAPA
jgi:hypothetical protein